jgi:hypothetical protein
MSQEYRPVKHERARDPASTDLLAQMSIEIHGKCAAITPVHSLNHTHTPTFSEQPTQSDAQSAPRRGAHARVQRA